MAPEQKTSDVDRQVYHEIPLCYKAKALDSRIASEKSSCTRDAAYDTLSHIELSRSTRLELYLPVDI